MHKIFEQRDYLDEVFSFLSIRNLAATICVNKTWFEASVFPLWKTINLSAALKLLTPADYTIHMHGFCKLSSFSNFKCVDNWERFMLYAQHVRILHAHAADSFAFAIIKDSIPPPLKNKLKYFFPDCRFFNWRTTTGLQVNAPELDVLLPPSVDHIVLTASGRAIYPYWFDQFCRLVSSSLPSLKVFRVNYDGFIAPLECSDSFLSLLTKFSSTLTYVWIPEMLFTDTTVEKLLECDLHHLMVARPSSVRHEELPVWGFTKDHADPKSPKRFSSLKSLVFGPSTSNSLVSNIPTLFSLPALTKFRWNISNIDFDFDAFATTISTAAPNLEVLIFGAFRSMKNAEVFSVISWVSVVRLLNCMKLTSLAIYCARVDMTLDNLVELLRSRQEPLSWNMLDIKGTQPLHFQDALLSVAKYSPGIRLLGLRVHDENYANLFNDIPELSSQLNPSQAKRDHIRTQLKLANQLEKSGFSLSRISTLRLHESVCSLYSMGPMAFLLLAICNSRTLKKFVINDNKDLEHCIRYRMEIYYHACRNFTD